MAINLHPQAKAIIEMMAALGGPVIHESTPAEFRAYYDSRWAPPTEDVHEIRDLSAGGVPSRLYRPSAAADLGLLVYYHGGGWVIGGLDSHDAVCRSLANKSGHAVLSVDYRLAPEHRFPAAVDDSLAATRWVQRHAAELGLDPARIAVGGDSAGGNLAAIVTQVARDKGGPGIAFQLLMFPNTQMDGETSSLNEYAVGYLLERHTIEWFNSQYAPEEADRASPLVSPLRARDFARLPPAYVMLGGYDPLHDEGLAYAQKLRAAGVAVTIADHADMVHCFIYLQTVLPQAHEAVSRAAHAVREALDAA